MDMRNFSYTELYNSHMRHKAELRKSIPADKITEATLQQWALEDQRDQMRLRYYQMLEERRKRLYDVEDDIADIKFKSEVRVKK